MAEDYKEAQTGFVLNDAADGTIFIGTDDGVTRPRQIEIHATSNACIKLFEDGGFEIQGQGGAKLADNISSTCEHGLLIKGKNIRLDAGTGEITLAARGIRYESSGHDQNLVISSKGNIDIRANDTVKIDGSVVAIGARTRMAIGCRGSIYVKANNGFTVIEPKTKLIPTSLSDFTNLLFQNLFPNYF